MLLSGSWLQNLSCYPTSLRSKSLISRSSTRLEIWLEGRQTWSLRYCNQTRGTEANRPLDCLIPKKLMAGSWQPHWTPSSSNPQESWKIWNLPANPKSGIKDVCQHCPTACRGVCVCVCFTFKCKDNSSYSGEKTPCMIQWFIKKKCIFSHHPISGPELLKTWNVLSDVSPKVSLVMLMKWVSDSL